MSCITLHASECPVKLVTLFKSSNAKVDRTIGLDLKSGQNLVKVVALSSCVDTESVRITELGDAVHVLNISCNIRVPQPGDLSGRSETERKLLAHKKSLEDELSTRQHGLDLLMGYAQSISSATTTPSDAIAILDTCLDARRASLRSIREIEGQIEEVDKALKEQSGLDWRQGTTNGQVTLEIISSQDCHALFQLSYLVSQASWEPHYELHANTSEGVRQPTVLLRFHARVTQSTGEDWKDTQLTFSPRSACTLMPTRQAIPELTPRMITVEHSPNIIWSTVQPAFPRFALFGQSAQAAAPSPQVSAFGQATQASVPLQDTSQAQHGSEGSNVSQHASQPDHTPDVSLQSSSSQAASTAPTPGGARLFGGGLFSGGLFGSRSVPHSAPPTAHDASGPMPDLHIGGEGLTTVVRETPRTEAFRLDSAGVETVPSDGTAHNVPIARLALAATFAWVCVPRVCAEAFIECRIANASAHRLLAGPLSVFVDGTLVVRTEIKDTYPGSEFVCSLGPDEALRVAYHRTAHTASEGEGDGAWRVRTTTCTLRTVLENRHAFALPAVVVRDSVPVADDARVQVRLRRIAPAGAAEDAGDTLPAETVLGKDVRWLGDVTGNLRQDKGLLFEWKCGLGAGEMAELVAEWIVTAPWDVAWMEAQ
ncbi:uncharacterized protein FIBRA_06850 [Fibroporia radiculosa]|uniref:DUF4139 domain-containing protein n=1 Tax=Fibroporia radiculosa TaxID=599839 RepID=J4GTP8_9APHY|nr:uncharacterized protein FIBRA_06850 [Fibroporia radiculosa]CCM04665.1 predicted protein [Fibroporia radiculosa]